MTVKQLILSTVVSVLLILSTILYTVSVHGSTVSVYGSTDVQVTDFQYTILVPCIDPQYGQLRQLNIRTPDLEALGLWSDYLENKLTVPELVAKLRNLDSSKELMNSVPPEALHQLFVQIELFCKPVVHKFLENNKPGYIVLENPGV